MGYKPTLGWQFNYLLTVGRFKEKKRLIQGGKVCRLYQLGKSDRSEGRSAAQRKDADCRKKSYFIRCVFLGQFPPSLTIVPSWRKGFREIQPKEA